MSRVLAPIEQDAFEPIRLAEVATSFLGIAASKAKNLFGSVIERAASQPIVVVKNDRPSAFVISPKAYLSLVRDREELLTLRAIEAEKSGYLSAEETDEFFEAARQRLQEKASQ